MGGLGSEIKKSYNPSPLTRDIWDPKNNLCFPWNGTITDPDLEKEIDNILNSTPEYSKLNKISKDKELLRLEPEWGDGGEYPVFDLYLYPEGGINNAGGVRFLGVLSIDYNEPEIGIDCDHLTWCTYKNPKNKINLKQFLLNYYSNQLKIWKAKQPDPFYEKRNIVEVVKWLECIIRKIKQYL